MVELAAAELSAANELPMPSSWVAAAEIAAGWVFTNDIYLSWVARGRPVEEVGHVGHGRWILVTGGGSMGLPWRNLSATAYRVNGFLTSGPNF